MKPVKRMTVGARLQLKPNRWGLGSMTRQAWLCLMCAVALTMCCFELHSAYAEPWTRQYVNSLPDSAFAAVETTPEGKKVRHLPHHDRRGRVDLPHVHNALSRLPQVKWIDPQHAAAAHEHLAAHLEDARHKHDVAR